MASEHIASIIGDGPEQEIKSAIDQLDILAKRIVEIQGLIKDIGRTNFTGNDKSASETIQQIDQVKKMQQEMAQMSQKVIALEAQLANARKRSTVALNDENKAIIEAQRNQDANIKTQMRLERAIEQLTKARQREEAEIAKQNNAYEQLKAEYNEAANASKKLGAEYFNLKRSGTATTEQLREMGQAVREASKNALELHKGLFDIEQAVGQSQRNVGNYNALMFETNQLLREAPNFALSARTGFMALSNNLPMFAEQFSNVARSIDDATGEVRGWRGALSEVGKSIFSWQTALIVGITLLLQYSDEIVDFFKGVSAAERKAKEENDEYVKSLKEIEVQHKQTAQEQISRMNILVGVAQDVNQKMNERLDAVNALRSEFPAYFKDLSNEAILYGDLTTEINKTTDALYHKAIADAYQAKAAKAADFFVQQKTELDDLADATAKYYIKHEDAIKSGKKLVDEYNKTLKPYETDETIFALKPEQTYEYKNYLDMMDEQKQKLVSIGKTQKDINKFQEDAIKEARQAGGLFIDSPTTKAPRTPDTTNAEIKAMNELAEARAAFNKQQITTDAATQKAIFDDEKQSMDFRLSAYGKYVQDKIALYELESGVELNQIMNKLAKIEDIEAKSADKRTKQEQKLLLQKEALELQRDTIIDTHSMVRTQMMADSQKMQLNILKSSGQRQIKELGQSMNGIDQYYQGIAETQIKSLSDALLNGEINVKEYNDKVKDIQRNAQKETLEAQINSIKNYLDNTQLDADTRAAIEKTLTDDKKKLYQADVENYKDSLAKKEALEKAWRDTAFDIAQDLLNVVGSIQNNNLQSQIDAIDAQKTALEDKNKTEIDGINSSMMSQQEKDAATEAANARLAAQEKALDNEKKARQRELAQAQKQQAIMNIILKTAEAVITAFTEGDAATKIPRAIAAAGTGAAELAIAYAAPLPQYATGTENHPGGLAVVGEKGSELVNLPSGQSFITPAVATVMDLPKHTEVIPHQDLLNKAHYDALNKVNMLNHSVSPNDYSQALISSFEKGLNRLEHTIKNKQEVHFFWKNGELRKSIKHGNNKTIFVNKI